MKVKGFAIRALTLCALLLSMLTMAGASEIEPIFIQNIYDDISSEYGAALLSLPEEGKFDPSSPGYGSQLTDPTAIDAYEKFLTITPEMTELTFSYEFDLDYPEDTEEQMALLGSLSAQYDRALSAALSAFMFDHPEMHYFTPGRYQVFFSSSDWKHFTLTFSYEIVQNPNSREDKAKLDAVVDEFRRNFDDSLPVMEQYRYIHDYICSLASYDDAAANCTDPDHDHSISHSAYGLLVYDLPVVCEGYAKSFKILCDAVDLPCILMVGEGAAEYDPNSPGLEFIHDVYPDAPEIYTNHMWNAVEVDGIWYAVDTTWDDIDDLPITNLPNTFLSLSCYDYFLNNETYIVDHRAIGKIHFDSSFDFPMVFGLPDLTTGIYPEAEGISPTHITIDYTGDDLEDDLDNLNISFGSFNVKDIPNVTVRFSNRQRFDNSFVIPAGKSYTFEPMPGGAATPSPMSYSDGDPGPSITHAKNFRGPLFSVSGSLTLDGINLDIDDGKSLARVNGGSFSASNYQNELSCQLHDSDELSRVLNWQVTYNAEGRMTGLTNLGSLSPSELYDYGFLFPTNSTPESKHFLLFPDFISIFFPENFDIILND